MTISKYVIPIVAFLILMACGGALFGLKDFLYVIHAIYLPLTLGTLCIATWFVIEDLVYERKKNKQKRRRHK